MHKHTLIRSVITAAFVGVTAESFAEHDHTLCLQSQAGFLAPAGSVEARQYAPDRFVDIKHLALDVTPNFEERTVKGTTTIHFTPIAKSLRELRLDAVELKISTIESDAPVKNWRIGKDALWITFDPPILAGAEAKVTIHHSAQPERGLYFRTPELGYRPEDTHIFTQGEPRMARHWFPCFDSPNEKFTTEITCRVPADMTVLSNGRQVERTVDEETGLQAARWHQDKPHVNYLIALVAGHFEGIKDQWRDIDLSFHAPVSQAEHAHNSFQDTRDMMEFFEQEIGVLYPWAQYGQVCVQDFVAGGMENTALTILTDRTLFADELENLRSSQGLVAHELVHQWFGDLVTCKDWSHLWLNEGFATYYENLYDLHKNGRDSFVWQLRNDAERVLSQANDQTPIVNRTFSKPNEQFSFRAYPKGAWVLHMLRSELGADLFRKGVRLYLERHSYDVATTEDLNEALEEVSGRSLDAFFDQWVYHAGTPVLDVSYQWNEEESLAQLTVKQTQKTSANVLLFRFPLRFRFKSEEMFEDRVVTIRDARQDFSFPLPKAPETVRIDPDTEVLARINFTPTTPMLHAQLDDAGDMMGRFLAVRALASRKDHETVERLDQVLREDSFHAVRIEASKALRGIHSEAAFAALRGGLDQPDARVRRQVIRDLRGWQSQEAFNLLAEALETNNPDIKREAILGLAPDGSEETDALLIALLDSESFDNIVAGAAIQAMRTRDQSEFVEPLRENLTSRRKAFRNNSYASALGTLAYLARRDDDKSVIREFLISAAEDNSPRVRRAAISALGTLGDEKAITYLETHAGAKAEEQLANAAKQAISQLRSKNTLDGELRGLRRDFTDLKRENSQLRKELDSLKKTVKALAEDDD